MNKNESEFIPWSRAWCPKSVLLTICRGDNVSWWQCCWQHAVSICPIDIVSFLSFWYSFKCILVTLFQVSLWQSVIVTKYSKLTKSVVQYVLVTKCPLYTVENFFAPLQLVCKSFVFFCTLLEFFYNYFVLQWSNVWRHILLITLNNIVKEYKIFEKINLFIHPFAKKLQIWWIKSFQKNCILVQKHCKLEQRKCN